MLVTIFHKGRTDSLALIIRERCHGVQIHSFDSAPEAFDDDRAEEDVPQQPVIVLYHQREAIWAGLA